MMPNHPTISLQHYSTPARASSTASSLGSSSESGRSGKGKLSQRQRFAANQRERRRMTSLNTAFDVLRRYLPENRAKEMSGKKPVSKVETLRLAIDYISKLQNELTDCGGDVGSVGSVFGASLVPVQGQLVRQLPDEHSVNYNQSPPMSTSTTPNYPLPPAIMTPSPPVYCFGGLVQHSVPQGGQVRQPTSSSSAHQSIWQPQTQLDFRPANNKVTLTMTSTKYNTFPPNYDAFLTPSSSYSPQPPFVFNNYPTLAPAAWYC